MSNELQLIRSIRQNPPNPPYGADLEGTTMAAEAWKKGFDLGLAMAETRLEHLQRKAEIHPYLKEAEENE